MSNAKTVARFTTVTLALVALVSIATLSTAASPWSTALEYLGLSSTNGSPETAGASVPEPAVTVPRTQFVNGRQSFMAPLSGSYNIPTDYATLGAAITDLNAQGVSGAVTFTITAATPQTAPVGGYIIGGAGSLILSGGTATSSTNTVTIQGNGNTITASSGQTVGSLADGVFKLVGADWITITNCNITESGSNTINTPAGSNNMTEWGVALLYVTTTDGAQNNTIQGNTITMNRTYLNTFGIYSNTRHSSTAPTTSAEVTSAAGSNSNNKIYTNAISNTNYGIVLIGAGTTIAAIDTGNDIGGAGATTGNTIINWGGGAALSNYVSLTGSNYCIFSNQQINDNVSFNTITSAALAQAVTTGGLLKNYSVASPVGTITTTINNNTVQVTNNPTSATAGGVIGINNQGLTPLLSTATMSINNNTVQNSVVGGSTSTTNGFTAITNLSLPGTLNMTGNNVLNNSITATTATSGTIAGIVNSGAAGTVNINSNIIRGFASTATSGQVQPISNTGAVVTALNINSNQLGNASGGLFTTSTATSGTLFGIVTSGGASTCALSIQSNDIRGITYNVPASAVQAYYQNSATTLSQNISSNTFTNLNVNTTGNVTFISNSVSAPSGGFKTINGNSIVTAFSKTGAGGTIALYSDGGSSTSTTAHQNNNNNFSNITVTGATTISGWFNNDGTGSTPTKNITGNTFSNWTCGTSAVTALQSNFGNPASVSSNTISNITGQGAVTGLSIGSSGTVSALTASNNTVTGLSSTGTGGAVTGISNAASSTTPASFTASSINNLSSTSTTATVAGISTSASATIAGNTINTLSVNGATSGVANGIMVTGGTAHTLSKNKVYDISATGAFATIPGVNGIVLSGATSSVTATVVNNLVGDLKAPNANSSDAIRGISVVATGTTSNYNVYYNSVWLNASSVGATFGTSGIFHTASATATTASLLLRNNLISNTSARAGGASVNTAAFRRSGSALNNFATTSNNNLLYGGVPSGTNLVYSDGTNDTSSITAYKTTMSPRETASFSENPPFLSTAGSNVNFLHIDSTVPTQIESGASPISGITDDYDGNTRNATTPDVGADEFAGTGLDLTPPAITYTALANTASLANRTLTTTITDATGVPTAGVGLPVLYWKINSGAYSPVTATYVSGSTYTFTFGTGVVASDTVSYYIVAQDTAGTPNVGSAPAGASGFTANPPAASTPPASPSTYTIVPSISGTKIVGATGDYATLTAAINALNGAEVTGPVVLSLTDAAYNAGTGETFPLPAINANNGSSSTNTITIRPAAGVSPTISGAAASGCLLRLNGADYVTIDGDNPDAGTNRNLTITNTSTTSPSAVCISSLGAGAGATNNTVKNTNISTGLVTAATSFGISVGSGLSGGTSGADNDSTTLQNNNITVANVGIYAVGTASVSAGGNDALAITSNIVDSSTALQNYGIQVGNALGSSISGNTVSVQTSGAFQPTAISLETGFVSSSVTGNTVTKALATNTGGYGGRGITIGTGSASSGLAVSNNVIYGVNGSNWNAFGNSSSMGIAIGTIGGSTTLTTTAGGVNLYFNSVSMTGSIGSGSASALTAAVYVGSGASALDLRNNVFSNTQTGTSTTQKNYAIYSAAANTAFTTINYNDYYVANSFNASSAVLGFLSSDRTTLSAIQSGFGGNGNSVNGNPQFLSATDLHISTSLTTPVESAGTPIAGITTDYDGDTRNGTTPDIGADEGTFIAPVANDVQATAFIDPTNGGSKLANTAFAPQASFTNNGTASQTSVPVRYRICSDGTCSAELYNDVQSIPTIATGVTSTITFSNIPGGLPVGTYTIKARSELAGDTVTANDELTGTLNVLGPLVGTYTVGAGGNYTSLTNNGGIFQALNSLGVSGQVFVDIVSNISGETGTHQLNDITLGNNITIRPVGGPWNITGSSAGSLIVLNGADNVVIDGSGTDANAGPIVGGDASLRKLTITNTNTGTSSAVVSIHTGTNGATNNVIKNINVVGSSSTAGTNIGIEISGNTVGSLGADNDNNRIVNCSVQKSFYGIAALGASAANQNQQNFINRNDLSATGANSIGLIGIYAVNVDNLQVQENSVGGISNAQSADTIGIAIGTQAISTTSSGSGGITNGTIHRNKVNGVVNTATYSAVGIAAACTTCELANNMVTGVRSDATSPDLPAGIFIVSGASTSTNVFHNSVSMTGDRGATTSQMPSYAIGIVGADTPVGMINNVFYTSQTASGGGANAKSYALGVVTSNINFSAEGNDYWSVGANDGGIRVGSLASAGGTDYATLGAFQSATGKDLAVPSQEVDPLFANPANDLHLTNLSGNTLLNAGYNNTWPQVDFDNDPRPTTTQPQTNLPHPDIGADELVQPAGGGLPAGTYYNVSLVNGDTYSGNVTISGALYLSGVTTGSGTLTLGCNATVTGASSLNYILGVVEKQFCGAGSFSYPVGTTGGYRPVTANVTTVANPSSLSVGAFPGVGPGVNPTNGVGINWNLIETGNITADITFDYDPGDIIGGPDTGFAVIKKEGNAAPVVVCAAGLCIDSGNSNATVTGVTQFSRWGIGAPLAPTAANVGLSGRLLTADGRGIKNAQVILTGGNLATPRVTLSSNFGYYTFDNLEAGETYVVNISSKRFIFQVPSRVVTVNDNLEGIDFVADPQE